MSCVSGVTFDTLPAKALTGIERLSSSSSKFEQLDGQIAVGVRAAKQNMTGLALVVRQRKGRIFQQFDVAVDQLAICSCRIGLPCSHA